MRDRDIRGGSHLGPTTGDCGVRLARLELSCHDPPMAGERRSATATVLFTDLVGSTELLAGLGDTAFDVLRRSHFATLREALAHQRGSWLRVLPPDPDKAKLFVGLSAAERKVRLDELHRRIHAKVPERECDGLDWDQQAWIKREVVKRDPTGSPFTRATTSWP